MLKYELYLHYVCWVKLIIDERFMLYAAIINVLNSKFGTTLPIQTRQTAQTENSPNMQQRPNSI